MEAKRQNRKSLFWRKNNRIKKIDDKKVIIYGRTQKNCNKKKVQTKKNQLRALIKKQSNKCAKT